MKNLLVLSLLALGLSACATRPDHIAPTLVSTEPYLARDCGQLSDSLQTAQADLKKFSDLQDSQATRDAASVFLVLIPASWFTGDHEKDVAKSKGEVAALDAAIQKKGCKAVKA